MDSKDIRLGYAHTYFCGHLNTKKRAKEVIQTNPRWKSEVLTEQQYHTISSIYYESFVDSLVDVADRKQEGVYGGTAHLTMEMCRHCRLKHPRLGSKDWEFYVCRLHLFFFPYEICLFAIEIDERQGADLNMLTFVHSLLRDVDFYEKMWGKTGSDNKAEEIIAPEYIESIQPLLDVCKVMEGGKLTHKPCYADLTYTGNKLKAFQIIGANDISDELLFELGTMSKIGCVKNHQDHFSPSQAYYDEIMKTNSVSAFRNWKALALVDSFTLLQKDGTAENLWIWRDSYFRLIYIHAFYQKTMLFVVNNQFRSDTMNDKCDSLLHKMKDQEHWYAFSNISYNFLPQMIYKAIDIGLEIASEREQLHRYLAQEAEHQERLRERRLGKLIFYLTILTVLSALYDGTSLIREFLNYDPGSCQQRWIVASGFFIVTVVFLIWGWTSYLRRKRNTL